MKRMTAILAVVAVAGFALTALGDEPAKPSLLYGKVVSVDAAAGKLVVAPKDGAQVTVVTDTKTKIVVKDKAAALGDIKADMTVRVSPATGTAIEIRAFVTTPAPTSQPKVSLLYGKVVSVDATAGTLLVAPKEGDKVTVTTDANTKIVVKDKAAALGDIKADMTVRVSPATGTATEIRAFLSK